MSEKVKRATHLPLFDPGLDEPGVESRSLLQEAGREGGSTGKALIVVRKTSNLKNRIPSSFTHL